LSRGAGNAQVASSYRAMSGQDRSGNVASGRGKYLV